MLDRTKKWRIALWPPHSYVQYVDGHWYQHFLIQPGSDQYRLDRVTSSIAPLFEQNVGQTHHFSCEQLWVEYAPLFDRVKKWRLDSWKPGAYVQYQNGQWYETFWSERTHDYTTTATSYRPARRPTCLIQKHWLGF